MNNILINKYKNLHWPKKSVLIFIIILSVILSISSLLIKSVETENEQVSLNHFFGKEAHSRYFIIGNPPLMAFVTRYHYGAPLFYVIKESYPKYRDKESSIMIDGAGFIANTLFIFIILMLCYLPFTYKYTKK